MCKLHVTLNAITIVSIYPYTSTQRGVEGRNGSEGTVAVYSPFGANSGPLILDLILDL